MILPHLRFEPAQFVEQELYDSFISDSESLVNMRLRNVLSENEVSVSKFIDIFKQGYNSDGVTNRGKRLFELFSATHFYEHPEMFREGMFEEIVEPRKAFYLERNKQEKGE